MSGEALKQEIRRGAEEKAEQALTEAKSQAEQTVAQAESEAKRLLDARMEDAQRRLEQIERSEAAKARMECTRRLLVLQSRYVDQAFSGAESLLNSLPLSDPTRYRNVLTRLIAEAAEDLGGSSLVALVREADRKMVKDVLRDLEESPGTGGRHPKVTISDEPLKASGGVVLRTEDGRSYFVNTFESKLLRAREDLRARVTDMLLGRSATT